MKKINTHFIVIQCIFLLIVFGGSILLYYTMGPYFYRAYRISIAKEAFENLQDVDLGEIDTDHALIEEYETNNFNFTIADENMNSVYQTNQTEKRVYRDIQLQIDNFSKTAVVIRRKRQNNESIRLLGIINQGEHSYYVSIRDNLKSIDGSFRFTVKILICVFLVAMATGSGIMYIMSKRLVNPINQLEGVSRKLAQRDFSEKAEENGRFDELNHLAESINSMSEQIQGYIKDIENNREKLLQQNMQQERLEKARKNFVSNVSHELKTPLAVISSQVEMLEYLPEEEQRAYYYTSIQEEITKMSEMVGNLLDITVLEHNMGRVLKKEISLNKIMNYILMKYDALFQRKSIQVETELEDYCKVYGEQEYIEQAISNFVMNALQHTENGNRIKISMHKINRDIFVRIYNQGQPIAKKDMENIWKSFYVPEQEREKEEEGLGHTGLGLYIVKSVIEMHGGSCGVQNIEEGVEFWFSIPSI